MPYLNREERAVCSRLESMSDEELFGVIRRCTEELGHPPAKHEIDYADYFKRRFGPWPRVLEMAGVKPLSKVKERRVAMNRRRRNKSHKQAAAKKRNLSEMPSGQAETSGERK